MSWVCITFLPILLCVQPILCVIRNYMDGIKRNFSTSRKLLNWNVEMENQLNYSFRTLTIYLKRINLECLAQIGISLLIH